MITFSWDNAKNELNKKKHGVSFEESRTAFDDDFGRVVYDPDHSDSEDCFIPMGMSCSMKILIVCHCYKCGDEEIRIISARKATKTEESQYRSFRK